MGLARKPRAVRRQNMRARRGAASSTLLTSRALHMRSAKAAPRGHALGSRLCSSISSPHKEASPPMTSAASAGVRSVPLSGSSAYAYGLQKK